MYPYEKENVNNNFAHDNFDSFLPDCYYIGIKQATEIILTDFFLSEDGTKLTFSIDNSLPMGYVRGYKDSGGGVKPHYLTFYYTFGEPNFKLGAKNKFVLKLDKNDTEIYFNRADGGYELVLQKMRLRENG